MKRLMIIFLILFFISCKKEDERITAVKELIERITPGYSSQFKLEIIESTDGQDVYEVSSEGKKIVLRGNNPVALATAFNWYLKYTCNAHVSWFGDQLNLPKVLPLPDSYERRVINGKYRVYMNYCTVSYSAAWWDWERWQREIDFMAMNSINMPLSVIGLDAIWYNTLLRFDFTDEEARAFLAGPGHQAWQWMQNLQSYGGPLPKSWIESHVVMGKEIMKRQLELGMQPIQQGFSGYVPREFIEKFPEAKIRLQPRWCAFIGAAQLDPTDDLFFKFGKAFLEEQDKLFGSHGVYAADPFHESAPPVNTVEYLNEVGISIHKLFKEFDKNAVWAMQAWDIRKDIATVVPKEDLLVLDLNGSKVYNLEGYWGYDYIAGNLHNFGGRINMHGDLKLLASNQYIKAKKNYPNIHGSGLFMEGIEQNPVYYDLAFEMPVYEGEVNIEKWLEKYALRRYGVKSENAYKALLCLLEGPYRPGTNGTERSSIVAARPALNVKKSGPNAGLGIPYDPLLVLKAQELLLKDASVLGNSKPYCFDIVDVQRQLMTNMGQLIHKSAVTAFMNKDKEKFEKHTQRFLMMLSDMDVLLRTRPEYNFDKWISDARSWGTTEEEKNLFEKDATTLVTIWGADGDPDIYDYSWREWSGLINGFYLPRWEKFYTMLQEHLEKGIPYSEEGLKQTHGREAFRANDFYNELAEWELKYTETYNKNRTPVVMGNEVECCKVLFDKYSALAKEYYKEKNEADIIKNEKTYENLGK